MGSGIEVSRARQRVLELLLRHRLPGAFNDCEFANAGALLSYASRASLGYGTERKAEYVDKALRGISPAELPVERSSSYEMAINMKTAKTLGLTIPASSLGRVDVVIE
jgi:putative ABC transport system substrate-binding protein